MHALFWLIDTALSLFVWALIIGAIVSLLIAFNVLDTRNRAVWAIADFFHRLTEPALRPIRRFIPNLGGIDISPVVLSSAVAGGAHPARGNSVRPAWR